METLVEGWGGNLKSMCVPLFFYCCNFTDLPACVAEVHCGIMFVVRGEGEGGEREIFFEKNNFFFDF